MDWKFYINLAVPVLTLFLGYFLKWYSESRPKLVGHYGHVAGFRMPKSGDQAAFNVNTHSIIIRNISSQTVKNVHLVHNYLPQFNIYPEINYRREKLPEGGEEIVVPMLVPRQEMTITYLYYSPITYDQIKTDIRTESGSFKKIDVQYAPVLSKKVIWLIWFFYNNGSNN